MSRKQSSRPLSNELTLEQSDEVDARCDEFDAQWEKGESPRIESFVENCQTDIRAALLYELIISDAQNREHANENVRLQNYLDRFPNEASIVVNAFDYFRRGTEAASECYETQKLVPQFTSGQRIGQENRFAIKRILGHGGFAIVYLAEDTRLERKVAIKSPRRPFNNEAELEEFLKDARTAAQLDEHPGIVRVLDAQAEGSFGFIVQQYIDGQSLGDRMRQSAIEPEQIVSLLIAVADALGHAHMRGFVHRDLKPANILLNAAEVPYVADFGLTVHESNQHLHQGELAGTLPYMSPEQIRGEVHRMDGRSDIWSLGVILYELLARQRPFVNRSTLEKDIEQKSPVPPRMRGGAAVPPQLARICMRCLEKRATDRYQSTADLIDDLRHWKEASPIANVHSWEEGKIDQLGVTPRGLRCFTEKDADQFFKLLPGPHDRFGVPRAIEFWKSRIETLDEDETFSVGIMYGPSGCGKSSLLRAGILPRIDDRIINIFIEATGEDTEQQLLTRLHKRCPDLSQELDFQETLSQLRGNGGYRGRKVLLVIDQFEQWLHSVPSFELNQFIIALRQCDGVNLQCLVLVRDDFWMSATRFMDALELPLVEGHNSGAVDLFDSKHAEYVLQQFGQGLKCLSSEMTDEEREFLTTSVSSLSQDGRISCIRLAVFAEMMRERDWRRESLEHVGGAEGIGAAFLHDQLSAKTAPLPHRGHHQAAIAVLEALLPLTGSNIKGEMKGTQELARVSGYRDSPKRFHDLLQILDHDLKLITPADREIASESGTSDNDDETKYQLTHDFLVPSLRQWLDQIRITTRRGRAEKRLAELELLWSEKHEKRFLPSALEYARIRIFTDSRSHTKRQTQLLAAARRYHMTLFGTLFALVAALGVTLYFTFSSMRWQNQEEQARTLVIAMSKSRGRLVPRSIADLSTLPNEIVLPELQKQFDSASGQDRTALAYALSAYGRLDAACLVKSVENAEPVELTNLVTALEGFDYGDIKPQMNAVFAGDPRSLQTRSRLAILAMHLKDTSFAESVAVLHSDPSSRSALIAELQTWHSDLQRLNDVAAANQQHSLRSAICSGLGGINADKLSKETKSAWRATLLKWYEDRNDAGLHSAAEWTMRSWEIPIPKVIPSRNPSAKAKWHLNSQDLVMVAIPRESSDDSQQRANFLISSKEISVGLFNQFIRDGTWPADQKPVNWNGAALQLSPSIGHPVQNVSWTDTLLFCNWLSKTANLRPVYSKVEGNWKADHQADGYRLPTLLEWEVASRARATTSYFFGQSDRELTYYASFSARQTLPCGSKCPNGYGLFDTHGNVWEWCWDTHESGSENRILKGGACVSRPADCTIQRKNFAQATRRIVIHGFRVARTARQ